MKIADGQFPMKHPRFIAFALALVTLLVYLPVCFHDWIFFDDPAYVLDNPIVHAGITWAGIKWAFVGWHASNWHPLTWLSHMLDCQWFGLNPGAQHFVNALFHAANAALLFVLWHRMTRQLGPSALVAALFAWHPLHVESVAWISERKDVLSAFFGLLTLMAYVSYVESSKAHSPKAKVQYTLAILFFAMGLLAKPMLVTLPFVMLLLDSWPLNRFNNTASSAADPNSRIVERGTRHTPVVRVFFEKIPFFLLTAASCLVTFLAQRQQAVVSLREFTLGVRLENVLVSYALYVLKIFWPVHLAVFYPLPEHIAPIKIIGAAVALALISTMAWRGLKSYPFALIGWLWFLGMLVPVIGLVQVGDQAMADRYTYLPSIGLFVAVVFGLGSGRRFMRVLAPVAAIGLIACIALTEYQLRFWQNTQTLFEHTLAVTGRNGPAHMMLGVWFERNGRPDDALDEYQRGLECDPSLMVQVMGGDKRPLAAQVQLLLGQSAAQSGDSKEALAHYRQALQVDADLVEAYNNLGNLLDNLGKPSEALTNYQMAARLQPNEPLVHENLGSEFLELGRFDEALNEYQEAAQLAPSDSRPFYLMGKAWLRRGESSKAVTELKTALQRDPNDYQSLTFLARILAAAEDSRVRNGTLAVTLAQHANALTGGKQPFVLASLAMAYAEAGRFQDARQTVTNALRLTPGNGQSHSNLQAQLRLYESNQPYRESFNPR